LSRARIAPLWDDLVTTGEDDDIFVTNSADAVAIRWAAHTWADSLPVNAEIVLFRDGSIQFNYNFAQDGLTPTIGLSSGDGSHHTMSARNNVSSIPGGETSRFARTGVLPPGLTLSSSGTISGIPTQPGTFQFPLHLEDSGAPKQVSDPEFLLAITSAPVISGIALEGPAGVIRFNTEPGRSYCVESCQNLASPAWLVLSNNIPGTGSPVAIADPVPAKGQRFYRLYSW